MKKLFSAKTTPIVSLFAASLCALSLHPTSLLAADPAATPKAEPAASATSQAANDDLSQYKTADTLYSHYEEVTKQRPEHPLQSEQEAKQFFTPHLQALDAISAAFEKQYPKDPRRWNMEYAAVLTQPIRAALGIAGASKAPGDVTTKLQTILDAPDAPASLKKRVFSGILAHDAQGVHDAQGYADWEQKAKTLSAKYPNQTDPDSVKFISAMVLANFDPDKAAALFTDLSQSAKDPVVAAQAKQYAERLTQQTQADKKENAMLANLKKAPLDVKFTAVDGSTVDLAKLRGKVVLIDFWATWCGPCMAEVPTVVATYKDLHNKGFDIIGISFDKDKASVLKVTKEKGMVWPQYFDGKGWSNDFGKRFGIQAIPAMWLVNKKGYLVTIHGRENLRAQVEKLLAE